MPRIPENPAELAALLNQPVSTELVAQAIAGVIHIARQRGQTLDELIEEVLQDDRILEQPDRLRLQSWVRQAWEQL